MSGVQESSIREGEAWVEVAWEDRLKAARPHTEPPGSQPLSKCSQREQMGEESVLEMIPWCSLWLANGELSPREDPPSGTSEGGWPEAADLDRQAPLLPRLFTEGGLGAQQLPVCPGLH